MSGLNSGIATIGIDIGKNSFYIVGQDQRGAVVLRQKWSRGQVEARLANLPPCLIGMEACVGPVKAWPGKRRARGSPSAAASLDGSCARRVRTRRPGRRNGRQARTKEHFKMRSSPMT